MSVLYGYLLGIPVVFFLAAVVIMVDVRKKLAKDMERSAAATLLGGGFVAFAASVVWPAALLFGLAVFVSSFFVKAVR